MEEIEKEYNKKNNVISVLIFLSKKTLLSNIQESQIKNLPCLSYKLISVSSLIQSTENIVSFKSSSATCASRNIVLKVAVLHVLVEILF
jgi:hypothetical protein